tara:strand:+ start:413 stop:1066 length:654 start_codon:yes stop_codon:yes gene_type:complete
MKKILLTAFSMMLIATSAFAVSIGVSGTALYYDASGTETTKSSSELNSTDEDGVAPIASFFIENETAAGGTIGIEVIPYGAKVATGSMSSDDDLETSGTNDVDVNFSNSITVYIENPIDSPLEGSFLKVGLSSIEIETDETLATGSTYGDERIMGLTVGFGTKRETTNGGFVKLVGEISRFQGATFESAADADSVRNSIELDDFNTAAFRLSVGKSF